MLSQRFLVAGVELRSGDRDGAAVPDSEGADASAAGRGHLLQGWPMVSVVYQAARVGQW